MARLLLVVALRDPFFLRTARHFLASPSRHGNFSDIETKKSAVPNYPGAALRAIDRASKFTDVPPRLG
jgi:hypothetical protein